VPVPDVHAKEGRVERPSTEAESPTTHRLVNRRRLPSEIGLLPPARYERLEPEGSAANLAVAPRSHRRSAAGSHGSSHSGRRCGPFGMRRREDRHDLASLQPLKWFGPDYGPAFRLRCAFSARTDIAGRAVCSIEWQLGHTGLRSLMGST